MHSLARQHGLNPSEVERTRHGRRWWTCLLPQTGSTSTARNAKLPMAPGEREFGVRERRRRPCGGRGASDSETRSRASRHPRTADAQPQPMHRCAAAGVRAGGSGARAATRRGARSARTHRARRRWSKRRARGARRRSPAVRALSGTLRWPSPRRAGAELHARGHGLTTQLAWAARASRTAFWSTAPGAATPGPPGAASPRARAAKRAPQSWSVTPPSAASWLAGTSRKPSETRTLVTSPPPQAPRPGAVAPAETSRYARGRPECAPPTGLPRRIRSHSPGQRGSQGEPRVLRARATRQPPPGAPALGRCAAWHARLSGRPPQGPRRPRPGAPHAQHPERRRAQAAAPGSKTARRRLPRYAGRSGVRECAVLAEERAARRYLQTARARSR